MNGWTMPTTGGWTCSCGAWVEPCNWHFCAGSAPVLRQMPHRCPVCEGRGTVPAGFYSRVTYAAGATPETCATCSGRGIVWS